MVLGELLMGQSKWGPGSCSQGSGLGRLATDSMFLTTNPYSSRVRPTSPGGSLPFFKEKPWFGYSQDSNVDWDARGAQTPKYWLLAGSFVATPHSSGAPEWLSNPSLGQPAILGSYWAVEHSRPYVPSRL
jgi:hypothetical protein